MRFPRLYGGLRLTGRGIRPYLGLRLFSIPLGKHQAQRKTVVIYHCSRCGHVNAPNSNYCSGCGAMFTA
jgi:hypothetical protein